METIFFVLFQILLYLFNRRSELNLHKQISCLEQVHIILGFIHKIRLSFLTFTQLGWLRFCFTHQLRDYNIIIKQISMDDYSDMTAQYIHLKFKLPKLAAKKIEEANRFIHDPNSAIKELLEKNNHHHNRIASEDKINHGLKESSSKTQMKRTTTLQQQDLHPERQLISIKMKKFRPANGSFSQFYGEQLSMNTDRIKKRSADKLTMRQFEIPKLDFITKEKSAKTYRKRNQHTLSSQTIDSVVRKRDKLYIDKLKQIRETSELLRQNSRFLLRKADSVCNINDHSFQKLQDESKRILTGEQNYVFDEQLSRTYRVNALQGQVKWKSKK